MGRIGIESNAIRVPGNPNVTREYEGRKFAQQGWPIWTTIDIEVDNSYEVITLTAEFNYEPGPNNPFEQRQNSKIGIWIPVEDEVHKGRYAKYEEDYKLPGKKNSSSKLSKWTFGRKATIEIRIEEAEEGDFSQKVALCVCPWFLTAYADDCELTLTLELSLIHI